MASSTSSSSSSSSFSLLLSIALFLSFFRPPVLVNGDADLIQRTCKSTKHYDLCVSSLKSDPTSPKADTKGLAAIMAGVGIANATATSSYLSSQVTSINASDMQVLKKVLKECADKYSNAGNSLQSAFRDIAAESYDYAYMHVMAAADYPNVCHSAFKRHGALSYPPDLAAREDGLKRICDVVLGIIDLMLADQ